MQSVPFANGDTMPQLGLGTWKADPGVVGAAVTEALRLGYRHIDCARIYGNEAEVGRALADAFRGGLKRDDVWITSKLWNDAHAPDDVRPALERTLADLGLDHLDLYLIHWPIAHKPGVTMPQTGEDYVHPDDLPLSTTWAAMETLVDAGLTRHIGVSNCSVPRLRALVDGARRAPEVNQIELHPYLQQPAMMAYCRQAGVHLTAYSPLGSSDRPAHLRGAAEPVLLQDPTVAAVATRHGATPAQVLLAWALRRGTSVIPKSVNPARLAQNLAAADLVLGDEDVAALAALDRQYRYVSGSFWVLPGGPHTLETLWGDA
ncbi:aldo/keto reductase [Roseospira visakhapatnamensis]|uniref:Alcohol dehydrogenase (NADP+) n=1 Tax=Roseospira visakhapatnamensis TaxID=390880 RepID=A0A7W6REB2_9PROT|nr:aldo/keto reductase [Roseospira visakhapatnamensis]MBB4266775.1 alcohol dehydrogenase (NADP+) [Roseospira visakhapatnamensis]